MGTGILKIGKALIIKNTDNNITHGRVENIDVKNAILILSSSSTVRIAKGEKVSIAIPTIEGMFNFDAEVIDISKDTRGLNLILKMPLKLIRIQRRRATRIPYLTRIMVSTERGVVIKGITLDVSTVGVGIMAEKGLLKNDKVTLSFSLKPIVGIDNLSATIAWMGKEDPHIGKYPYGLKFEDMDKPIEEAIQKFVNLKLESVDL